jgi:hypothetical protein
MLQYRDRVPVLVRGNVHVGVWVVVVCETFPASLIGKAPGPGPGESWFESMAGSAGHIEDEVGLRGLTNPVRPDVEAGDNGVPCRCALF